MNTHTANGLFRVKGSRNEHKVSFSELFFDLVFVYAITQTAHLLIKDFTPFGVLHGFMILLAVWWVWVFTTWVTNWLDPERIPVRLLLFILMLLGMILSLAIPESFDEKGLLFALAYVFMQLGRTLFFCIHSRKHNPVLYKDFFRMSLWFSLSAIFWIYGAFKEEHERTIYWIIALSIEYLSAFLSFRVPYLGKSDSQNWKISGEHMAERCGLLIIIALGESLLVTGNSFAHTQHDSATIIAFISAFISTVTMWWIYFSLSAERASHQISASSQTGNLARLVYTYIHFLIIAGIVLSAVADEFILVHAHDPVSTGILVASIGGPVLYLIGNILFKTIIFNSHPRSHYLGLVLLLVLAAAYKMLTPSTLGLSVSMILVFVACWETISVMRKGNCD